MSPYKLVRGSDKNLAAFESQVNQALGSGYDLANDLVVHPISGGTGNTEFMLFQALVNEEILNRAGDDEDDEDLDDDEYEDDDDFEDYEEEEDEE